MASRSSREKKILLQISCKQLQQPDNADIHTHPSSVPSPWERGPRQLVGIQGVRERNVLQYEGVVVFG
jgi:hypothetical protein